MKTKTIVIVTPLLELGGLLGELFSHEGAVAYTYAAAHKLRELPPPAAPDLLVLVPGTAMPHALSALAELHAIPFCQGVPRLFLHTALEPAQPAGWFAYVRIPCSLDEILAAARAALEGR
jgi:hypothetical protein